MRSGRRTFLILAAGAAFVLWLALAIPFPEARGEDDALYVDPRLPEAFSATYHPGTRATGNGASKAFRTLKGAAEAAVAGQTVFLRAGTYTENLAPNNSGEEGRPLTFRNYPDEEAVITGEALSPAIDLSRRHHVTVEGLKVSRVRRWLLAVKAHHLVLKGNTFSEAMDAGGSSRTGLMFQEATHNRIVGNEIHNSTQDNLALIKSDRNLVEGNRFSRARHTLWTIKGGCFNVIRGNHFHNEWQKIGEVFDCDKVGIDHELTGFDITRRNLVERNVFACTPSSGDHSPYAGVQYAGQQGIVRHNVFHDNTGPGLDLTAYPEEARFNTGNRVYNNTFSRNRFAGIALAGDRGDPNYAFSDNIVRNNILAGNVFERNDRRWEWYKTLDGLPVQVFAGKARGFRFERNLIFGKGKGDAGLIVVGRRDRRDNPPPRDLAWWTANHAETFKECIEANPRFVDSDKRDFRLKADSAAVDAGAFLSVTAAAGEGTAMPVKDAAWFFDGFGIEGLEGDEIQLEGQAERVRIVNSDLGKNVLHLNKGLSWRAGQGVGLAYVGKAPDLGAHEFDPGTAGGMR